MKNSFILRVVITAIAATVIIVGVNLHRQMKVDEFLAVKTQLVEDEYKMIYNIYKDLAYNTFYGMINEEKILKTFSKAQDDLSATREELFELLKNDYEHLVSMNFHQIHFHLPNNRSFLRMHAPDEYGDDLTQDRYTVAYVNEYKVPIDGFEEGKVINGYRFVFPLFYENRYIGSVEASINSNAFQKKYKDSFGDHVHFLFDKEVVHNKVFKKHWDNYVESIESPKYLYTKQSFEKEIEQEHENFYTFFGNECLKNLDRAFEFKKPISLYKKYKDQHKIISIIPIENVEDAKVVAFFVVYSNGKYVYDINQTYFMIMLALFVIFLLSILYQRHEFKHVEDLNYAVEEAIEKQKVQQDVLLRQSKLAQMGELLSMIAHQWRQPLNAISAVSSEMKVSYILDGTDEKHQYEIKNLEKIEAYVQHLSKTIDDFRNFYKPEKKSERVNIDYPIKTAVNILRNELNKNHIAIEYVSLTRGEITTYTSELTQVILNILNNAKEQFIKENISDRKLEIFVTQDDSTFIIKIKDNAGGASEHVLAHMFELNFSTKLKDTGTGLGLHMSKIIIEDHCKGTIEAANVDNGLEFCIKLKSIDV